MDIEKKKQLKISRKNNFKLQKLLGEKAWGAYCEIYRQVTGEEYWNTKKRFNKKYSIQNKDKTEKIRVRKYYSIEDLKNLNTIAKKFIDYIENYNLRIESNTQIEKIIKKIGEDWRSKGNIPKKISFD